ncbi:MAG: DUF4382 domain-containing protein [Candidatus Sulfotelmatobacter sp.]
MNSTSPATVNVAISDPATCSAPQGPFSHIYVTITDVQINASSSAGDNDPGWVDLTPSLQQNPQQVDLLGQANNQCFLAMLGSTTGLQPGNYQQIRIVLANNSTTVTSNLCGGAANCVMLTADQTGAPQPLLLSGESKTGIKIPSGQIAGGQFTIAAGQTKDLDIDFDACASIVTEGNGQFRLKPVLHAGEVALTSSSINGKVVDSVTGQPIGGTAVVALEQKDNAGVDRVIMETVTDSTGAFIFCPVAAGTYDLVASAVNGAQVTYGATVIAGVQPGNALGTVPLAAQAGTNQAPASITGQVTSSTGSAPIAVDISVSALQPATVSGLTVLVTIPLAAQSTTAANVTTATAGICAANTDCVNYTLSVPAANPSVGAFSTGGTQSAAAPAPGTVNYSVDARAFVPGGPLDCTPSDLQTSSTVTNAPLAVTAGSSVTAATLAFSGCQ